MLMVFPHHDYWLAYFCEFWKRKIKPKLSKMKKKEIQNNWFWPINDRIFWWLLDRFFCFLEKKILTFFFTISFFFDSCHPVTTMYVLRCMDTPARLSCHLSKGGYFQINPLQGLLLEIKDFCKKRFFLSKVVHKFFKDTIISLGGIPIILNWDIRYKTQTYAQVLSLP